MIRGMARLLVCVLTLGCGCSSYGQGRIDPILPPGPLKTSRTALIFPGINTVKDPDAVVPPLTSAQKFSMFRRRTLDFSFPVEALMFATLSHSTGYSPRYGEGPRGFSERFASYTGSMASSNFFAGALLPSLLHQDPRYFRKGRGSAMSRILYAFKSEAVTRSDSGDLTFNTSNVLGLGMSTALTNAWYPGKVSFGGTMQRFGIRLAITGALNLFREFGGEYKPQP